MKRYIRATAVGFVLMVLGSLTVSLLCSSCSGSKKREALPVSNVDNSTADSEKRGEGAK